MTTTLVQRYGLLAPVEGAELVAEQMRAGARYYNDLISLERCRRDVFRELRRKAAPELLVLEQHVDALASELKELRQQLLGARLKARSRVVDRETASRAQSVRTDLVAARSALRSARRRCADDAALREATAALQERGDRWHKALRASTPAYWGTYLLAEASYEQARRSLVDPKFRGARGHERVSRTGRGAPDGRIGVQLQGGVSPTELYACEDTRARLEPVSLWGPWSGTSDVRRAAYARLWLRVGSSNRAPVWAVFPIKLHRPLPQDARIKSIVVRLRVVGMREEWSASFTYSYEVKRAPQRGGAVALDLGWRKRPDGSLRVAYWVDGEGGHGEILMPQSARARLQKTRELREIQDRYFNRATRWLAWWLRAASSRAPVPEWLRAECEQVGKWRSHARLRRLVVRWRAERFQGDGRIFVALERWMHRSRHQYEWESDARENALEQRRDLYRTTAARFARNYGTVVMERFDLRQVKRLPSPEHKESEVPRTQRLQLNEAAPGELRTAIRQAVERAGGVVVELQALGTTSHCHACGAVCSWDQASEVWHRCEHCGELWDQDRNAAVNLLRAWQSDRQGGGTDAVVTRKASKRAARLAKHHAYRPES
jgi:transposase